MTIKKRFFISFTFSLSLICNLVTVFHLKTPFISADQNLYLGLVSAIITFHMWFGSLTDNLHLKQIIRDFSASLFITSLIILPIITHYLVNISSNLYIFLIGIGICCGTLSLKDNEDLETETLDKIPKNRYFTIALCIVFTIFITSKFLMPLFYTGTYIDEYFHILSGINLLENGKFAEMYAGQNYSRSPYISILATAIIYIFGKSIFALKLIPIGIGIINFFLAFQISKKIFVRRESILLFLLSYTLNPLTILNHFYIRFNVFYELVILLTIQLFFKISEALDKRDYKKLYKYITCVFVLDLCNYFLNGDSLRYLGILLTAIFSVTCFIYIAKKTAFLEKVKETRVLRIAVIIIVSLGIILGLSLKESFIQIFIGTLNNEQTLLVNEYSLNTFLFQRSLGLTLLFISSVILLLRSKQKHIYWLIIISFALFLLHLVSSPSLKIVRGFFYFIPVYYLISFKALESLKIQNHYKVYLGALVFLSIATTYPTDFFKTPQIKNDLNYQDYSNAFSFMKDKCRETTNIALIHFPDISYFYNVQIDYTNYIFRDLLTSDKRYHLSGDRYFTNFRKIPVHEDTNLISTIFKDDQNVCIITYREYNDTYRYLKQSEFNNLSNIFQKKEFTNFIVYYSQLTSSLEK